MWEAEKLLTLIGGSRTMKKLFFVLSTAVVTLVACNKENQGIVPDVKKTTITVGIDAPETKTELTGTVSLLWSAGDAILISNTAGVLKTFTLEGPGGSATGTFSINEEVEIQGGVNGAQSYYPETLAPTWNGDEEKWHVTLPAEYTWSESGVKAPMYAWLNKDEPWDCFKLMTSVLKVDVYNIPAAASKLVFTANSEKLSGDFVFPYDCIPVLAGSDNKSITISFPAGDKTDRTFFIPVPYGSYSAGATIALKNSADAVLFYKTAPAFVVTKENITYFPSINFSAQKTKMTVWEGSKNVGESAWEDFALPMDLDLWASLPVGTEVTVYLTKTNGAEYAQMKPACQYTSSWTWVKLEDEAEVTGETTQRTFTLTSTHLGYLTNDCQSFLISGQNFTLTKVEVTLPKPERVIWTGSADLGDWSLDIGNDIPTSFWKNLPSGGIVTIYFTENGSVADDAWSQVHFYAKTSPDWTDLGYNSYQKASGHRSYCCVPLSAEGIASIKANGAAIKGFGLTVTKVTLR